MTGKHFIPLFTKQDWLKRFGTDMMENPSLLLGHTAAVEMFLQRLISIKENSNSFEQLQANLQTLITEQKEFLQDIDDKLFGDDHEKYGLPYMGPT